MELLSLTNRGLQFGCCSVHNETQAAEIIANFFYVFPIVLSPSNSQNLHRQSVPICLHFQQISDTYLENFSS